jgi:type III pantothenate kinase
MKEPQVFLAIDIGNSMTKTGIFIDDLLSETHFLKDDQSLPELIKLHQIKKIGISSVVPEKSKNLFNIISKNFSIDSHLITKNSKFNLEIDYETPETLGNDRICSAEGAFLLFKKKSNSFDKKTIIISIDLGTATTINVVKYPGIFIGGIIAPGINLMIDSLNKNTAQLPDAAVSDFKNFIGKSTKQSIAAGVIYSAVGLIEKLLNEVRQIFNTENLEIFITGGNAETLLPHFKFNYTYEKNLVLYGIKSICSINVK